MTSKSTLDIINLNDALKNKKYKKAFQIYLDFEKSILKTLFVNEIKILPENENSPERLNPFPLIICSTLFKLALQEDKKNDMKEFKPKENLQKLNEFFKNTDNIDQIVGSSLINDLLTNLIHCAINELENENMDEPNLMDRIFGVYKLFEQFLFALERSHLYTPFSINTQLIYLCFLLCKRMNELIKSCVNMNTISNSKINEIQNTFQNNVNQLENNNKFCIQQLHEHYQWQLKNSQEIYKSNIEEIYRKTEESKNELWKRVNLSTIDTIHEQELMLNNQLELIEKIISEIKTYGMNDDDDDELTQDD